MDDVRLRLNWMWYGSHAGFALGKDKGYYQGCRDRPRHPLGQRLGSAHRLVANGDSDLLLRLLRLAGQLSPRKGAPLISVGVIDAIGTEAIIVRPDAGIKTIGDLKGKKLLTTANAGVNTFFPLVLKNAGLTEGDIKLTNVPEGALVSSYLQGAGGAVGMLGGLDDKPAEIKANGGADPVTFPYSDFGVNQVGYCIVDHEGHGRQESGSGEALHGGDRQILQGGRSQIPTRRSTPWPTSSAAPMNDDGRQGAGARGARRDARASSISKANKDKVARPQRALRLGGHARS